MELIEKTVSTELIYDGKIIKVQRDTITLPDGNMAVREVVKHSQGVCILAVDENDDVVVVKQYRYPYGKVLLELPAGKMEFGEDPLECAKRELLEETGIIASRYKYYGEIYPSPGYTDEIIHLYLATELKQSEASPDDDEFLKVERHNIFKLIKMISNGALKDAKSIVALMRYAIK